MNGSLLLLARARVCDLALMVLILLSHQTERSSVTAKPREQEVSAWHEEAGERLVWTPGAAVQLMLCA